MQFSIILLVFGAFIVFAYSLPTQRSTETEESIKNLSHVSEVSDSKELNPFMVFVGERGPKSEVMLQFVYKGNNEVEVKGTDKDKYAIDSHKAMTDNHTDSKDVNKITILQNSNAQKENYSESELLGKSSPKNKTATLLHHFRTTELSSLVPQEVSPITGKWPKYLYDSFAPVHPFPELHYKKSSLINEKNQPSFLLTDSYVPLNPDEKKQIPDTAGPQLNPLSVIEEEFRMPIYK